MLGMYAARHHLNINSLIKNLLQAICRQIVGEVYTKTKKIASMAKDMVWQVGSLLHT